MNYKDTLLKLLNGISSDNAVEIEKACHTFLAITGVVSVEESERELASQLTKRAADGGGLPHEGVPCVHCGENPYKVGFGNCPRR